jgi:hypothetical protein
MTVLKLIRSKAFDTNGTKGITYTCALKGRVLNVSSLSFADEDKDCLKADDKAMILTINCNIEVVEAPYWDAVNEKSITGLKVMPAFGVAISKF